MKCQFLVPRKGIEPIYARYERDAFTIMLAGHYVILFLKTFLNSLVSTNFTTRF
jgi:hypothetical protein